MRTTALRLSHDRDYSKVDVYEQALLSKTYERLVEKHADIKKKKKNLTSILVINRDFNSF